MIVEIGIGLAALGILAKLAGRRTGSKAVTSSAQVTGSQVIIHNRVMRAGNISYTLTDDDLLWLARAIYGEAGTHREGGIAVAWALAQNHLLIGSNPPRMGTFAALTRAYCQPINPVWQDVNSRQCQRNPSACAPERIQHRRNLSGMAWNSIPESVRNIVTSFATGALPNPIPGLTEWSANRYATARQNIGGNWFGTRA